MKDNTQSVPDPNAEGQKPEELDVVVKDDIEMLNGITEKYDLTVLEKKVIHKTITNTLSVLEKPVNKVSMELPTIILEDRKKQAKPRSLSRDVSSKPKSVSVFGGRSDKHKPASKEVNAQRAHNTNTRKIPEKPGKNNEIKSVTVRTFGKKKKTEAGA